MRRNVRAVFTALALCVSGLSSAQAPDVCKAFLQYPIFSTSTTTTSAQSQESFRLFECSANFKSASDAQKAGISATIPIYDIPVPFSLNWDDNKVESWKSSHCSDTERHSQSGLAYYQAVYATNPVSANDALACYQAQFQVQAEAQSTTAVRCELNETDNAYVFNAVWRRTAGETGPAPVVTSFTEMNSTCSNDAALAAGTSLSEGGTPLLCKVTNIAGAFALTTSRGGCSASGRYRAPKLVMPLTMHLTAPFTQVADQIEFPSGMAVVTNGFALTISANRLTVDGPASITSFATATATPGTNSSASAISLTAKEVLGAGGVAILNAGQNGSQGTAGTQGPPGQPGGPGTGRTTNWQKNCTFGAGGLLGQVLATGCSLAPVGCEGGDNGGHGTSGLQGNAGNPGYTGGAAGTVFIDVDPVGRKLFNVLTDTRLGGVGATCQGQICGGAGGSGGVGGVGGIGGPGGPGAPKTIYCGGTDNGLPGGQGPQGPQGPKGGDGPTAQVRG